MRDWVLRSDLEWDHFFHAEFDPDIAQCDYAPVNRTILLAESRIELPVTAAITYKSGEVGYRQVRYSHDVRKRGNDPKETARLIQAAAAEGIRYEVWTEIEIRRNVVQLANWRRMVAWLSAAREHGLDWYIDEIASTFRSHQTFKLVDVEKAWGEAAFPLYAAAVFQAVRLGTYVADTDKEILSPETVISKGSVQ
ncbi:MAG: hypothetical protein V4508_12895 [Pseudomonadota bacterium]